MIVNEESSDNVTVAAIASVGAILAAGIIAASVIYVFYIRKKKTKVLKPPNYLAIEYGDNYKKQPSMSQSKMLLLLSLENVRNNYLFN